MNISEEVVVESGLANEKALPKDAQIMVSILRDIGITEFEPRVINQVQSVPKDHSDLWCAIFLPWPCHGMLISGLSQFLLMTHSPIKMIQYVRSSPSK